jgi:uncharacterized protein (TIGR02145 family)
LELVEYLLRQILLKRRKNMKSKIILIILFLSLSACTTSAETNRETMTDIDVNVYHTIKIGSQVWMTENLKTTRYNDGSKIPNVSASAAWSEQKIGAFCWYENESKNKNTFGALYNFYTVIDKRGICPSGWHVPAYDDWITLQTYLGGDTIAGGKMKEAGTVHWTGPNVGATNKSGFTALPAGGRGAKGGFGEMGNYATWWSSTSDEETYAWHWGLQYDNAGTRSNPGHKASGFSVRCIKD